MKASYEVRVMVEVVNLNVKSHRNGHLIKRRELKAMTFGDGKPNQVDMNQARRCAASLEQAITGSLELAAAFASAD